MNHDVLENTFEQLVALFFRHERPDARDLFGLETKHRVLDEFRHDVGGGSHTAGGGFTDERFAIVQQLPEKRNEQTVVAARGSLHCADAYECATGASVLVII